VISRSLVAAVACLNVFAPSAFAAPGDPIEGVAIIIRAYPGGAVAADGVTDADGEAVFKLPVRGYRVTFLLPPDAAKKLAPNGSEPSRNDTGSSYHSARADSPGLAVSMVGNDLEAEVSSASGPFYADLILAYDETVTIRVIEGTGSACARRTPWNCPD
jgi:hypothetical protein